MPINKYSKERGGLATVGRRFGYWMKGAEKRKITKNGREIEISGQDLDHWRFVHEFADYGDLDKYQREEMESHIRLIRDLYGEQPRRFEDVALCAATPEAVLDNWFESWRGSQRVNRRCDGLEMVKYWTPEGYKSDPIPCLCKEQAEMICKASARLAIQLTQFSSSIGQLGYFMLRTHSEGEIDNMRKVLNYAYTHYGPLDTIPFVLERRPEEIPFDTKDKTTGELRPAKSTHWMIYLDVSPDWLRRKRAAQTAQLSAPVVAALQAETPARSDVDSDGVIIEETPPVESSLMLNDPKLRVAFFEAALDKGLDQGKVLAILKRRGIKQGLSALDWFEACEIVGIEADPPETAYEF